MAARQIHERTLRRKVSLLPILMFLFLNANIIVIPIKKLIIPVDAKTPHSSLLFSKSNIAGMNIMQPREEISSPMIYKTDLKFIY